MLLVVGVGGIIGRRLFQFLAERHTDVWGTSHQASLAVQPATCYLDLLAPDFSFLPRIASGLSHAVVCSGETNIDRCKVDEVRCHLINVTHTIQLIEELWNYGITPIFMSSDAVFDGQLGHYTEEDICAPATAYGRQKLEVEQFLRKSQQPSLILRMTKVFDVHFQDGTLITSWVDAMRAGRQIRLASDQFLCLTYVMDVCGAVEVLIQASQRGVFHIASHDCLSRYELGIKVANYFGLGPDLVAKCSILDFSFVEPRPFHSTLSSEKLCQKVGFQVTSLETCLEMIARNYAVRESLSYGGKYGPKNDQGTSESDSI